MRPAAEMTPEQAEQELRGYISPALRRVTAEAMRRPVKLVKNGTWDVTGKGTLGEGLKGLAKIHELEHAPAEGKRPKSVDCESCGKPIVVMRRGAIPKVCTGAGGCFRQSVCAGERCRKRPPASAFEAHSVRVRGGRPWRCHSCSKSHCFGTTPTVMIERQSVCAGDGCTMVPPERAFQANALKDREGRPWMCRPCAARYRWAQGKGSPSRQMSDGVRAFHASRTPEQRSLRMKKAWETRRRRAAEAAAKGPTT